MAEAFTAGVKPGGLTDNTQIRILLCYLIKSAGPVPRSVLEGALLEEELANYFEVASSLADLEKQGLAAVDESDRFRITKNGLTVADTLSLDLPRTVREAAIRSVLRFQKWIHKTAMNRAKVCQTDDGYTVDCAIGDMGNDIFRLQLTMPDALTADMVKNRFIARGSDIYATLMDELTKPVQRDDEPPQAL